jgi:tetratricopeptide (TPR) repeat protein
MLLALANKSWLQQVEEGRFLLHDVLRQYGYEHLLTNTEAWKEANDSHANFYVYFLERQEQELRGEKQIEAANILNREFSNNIQAAWNWLIESKRFGDLVNKMLPGLFHFSMIRSQGEMLIPLAAEARKRIPNDESREKLLQRVILETVETYFEVERIILDDKPQEQLANLWAQVQESGLSGEMGFWFVVLNAAYREGLGFNKDYQGFRELLNTVRGQNDPWLTGYSLLLLSGDIMAEASPPDAYEFLEEALKIFREKGAIHEQGLALRCLGQNAWDQNSFGEVRRYLMAAQELFAKAEDYFRVGSTWLFQAEIDMLEGDLDQAVLAYQEQRRAFEKIGYRRGLGFSLSWESMAAARYGTLEHALQTRLKSLEIAREIGHHNDIGWFIWELGELYRLMGNYDQACSCYQQSFPLFEELPDFNGLGFYYRGLGEIALELEDWEEARSQFQKSIEVLEHEHRYMRPWSIGYAQAGLGISLIGLGNYSKARQVLQDSIRNGESCGHVDLMLVSLVGFARLYAATGSCASSIELATLVINHRLTWNEAKKRAHTVLEIASRVLPDMIVQAAQIRGLAMTFEEAVAYALEDR